MTNEFEYFLLVSQELNISRAAQKAFVSQQYISKCIRQLEEQFGVTLLNRKPTLSLTLHGEILSRHLAQMKVQEESLMAELNEAKDESRGSLIFGCAYGRAFYLLPAVLPAFCKAYPKVSFVAKYEMTAAMEKLATKGYLDLFLAVAFDPPAQLEAIELTRETIHVVISDNLLMRYFPEEYPSCKTRFSRGVDLHEFAHIPFLINPDISVTNIMISDFLKEQNIQLAYPITLNGNEIQMLLALQDCGACFCQSFLIPQVKEVSENGSAHQRLNIFPISGFDRQYPISLVYHKGRILPSYMKYFIQLVRSFYLGEINGSPAGNFFSTIPPLI